MRTNSKQRSLDRLRASLALALVVGAGVTISAGSTSAGTIGPGFSKTFVPDTIGPGSSSTLVFAITNGAKPASSLAFTDTLPAGVVIADAPAITNECGGTVTAPAGGSTITLTDGIVGIAETCEISVNVTSSTIGVHTNVSSPLTSDQGTGDTATDDLSVVASLPGFSKSFAPATVAFGGRSTLTFTIDNSVSGDPVNRLDFTDNLPSGMTVASPSNKMTDCGTPEIPPTLTAAAGSSTITLAANGTVGFPAIDEGEICTVVVDVIGGAVGSLENVSGELQITAAAASLSAGRATATLQVSAIGSVLEIAKDFIDDPVPPGGTAALAITITNRDRADTATDIAFSDDLDATLTGLVATGATTNTCGGMATSSFPMAVFSYEGGSLAPEGSCTIILDLAVPPTADNGAYPNTTSNVTGTVGGETVVGNQAGDILNVVSFPILTKQFTDDPVGSGGSVTLEFTITNPEDDSTMSGIAFVDELTDGSGGFPPDTTSGFLPFPVSVTLPPVPDPPCGAGSSLALVNFDTDRQRLELTGGSLAAAGDAGDSCTFSVTVDIPAGLASGTYTNTTEEIEAVLDDLAGPPTLTGPAASDDIVIVGAPTLRKEFIDDPVPPGGTTTLEFTIDNSDPDNAATAIAFTDDLGATLAGLTATSIDGNDCGGTVDITDPSQIIVSGAAVAADTSCTITATLTVPGGAPAGTVTNTTSAIAATLAGLGTTGPAAEDDLLITGLLFGKEFLPDTLIAGQTATLRFTLDNTTGSTDATDISFSDDLAAILPGTPDVELVSVPPMPCGGTVISTTSSLALSGGTVLAGESCSFDATVQVPVGAADGTYINTTSNLSATIDGTPTVLPPAVDVITIDGDIIAIDKEFTDDPATPGGSTTLTFAVENLSSSDPITDIEFSDDLEATLSGLEASSVDINSCGATVDISTPTSILVTGGSLAPGASCTIVLTLTVPPGPFAGNVFANSTSVPTGKVGALDVSGNVATDDLVVDTVTFTKSFDGPSTATGTPTLTFTIENLDTTSAVGPISFSDDLGAVLPGLTAVSLPSTPCGSGSAVSGSVFLTLTGGELAAGTSCSFDVTLGVPAGAAPGGYLNTTSQLFSAGLRLADPAAATLTIEPPPTFAKLFAPDTINVDEVSTLTFTIDNTASALAATALDFTDNLPAGTAVSSTPNASTTCTGGTLTAAAGGTSISYTGGAVSAGASCTVSVDVIGTAAGAVVNTSGDLTSSSGNSGTATDTLTIGAPEADISVTKTDGRTSAVPGQDTITYTIVVANAGPSDDPAVDVDDVFPAALTCSWTSTASGGASGNSSSSGDAIGDTLSMPNGSSVTYTATCTIDPSATGSLSNSATATASVEDPDTGNNTDDDSTSLVPAADISVTKTDGRTSAVPGQDTITYTIVVANAGPSDDPAVDVDDVFPAALTCSWTSTAAGGATGGSASGNAAIDDTLSMPSGSSVTYTADCTIDPSATGDVSNTATATGSVGDPNTSNNIADDSTSLAPEADISITKTDNRTSAVAGRDTIIYTIVVSNAGPSTDPAVTVTDRFPPVLSCTWTSTSSGGAFGNSAVGSGDIIETIAMPSGSAVTYTTACTASPTAAGNLTNTARAKGSVTDPNPSNGAANDNNTQLTPLPPAPVIPPTGSDGPTILPAALAMLIAGGALLLFARRRRFGS